MKIRPVGAESFHENERTDRRTDMTKPIVAFGNFANPPIKRNREAGVKSRTDKTESNTESLGIRQLFIS
jgi:hypothetical protein